MGQHRDDPEDRAWSAQQTALEAALTEIEQEPIPPRMRELALRLQRVLHEALARQRTD